MRPEEKEGWDERDEKNGEDKVDGVEEGWRLRTARVMRRKDEGCKSSAASGAEVVLPQAPISQDLFFFISRCFFLLTSLPPFGQITIGLRFMGFVL